jgi:preprotein translocase subunit SecG
MLTSILLVLHVLIAVALITLILLQNGKGADVSAAFGAGGGASSTVFGSQGAGNFLTRSTAILATSFFVVSLTLFYLAAHREPDQGLADQLEAQQGAGRSEGAPTAPTSPDSQPSDPRTPGDVPELPQ